MFLSLCCLGRFFLPVSMVICNDIFAYIFGMFIFFPSKVLDISLNVYKLAAVIPYMYYSTFLTLEFSHCSSHFLKFDMR